MPTIQQMRNKELRKYMASVLVDIVEQYAERQQTKREIRMRKLKHLYERKFADIHFPQDADYSIYEDICENCF